MTHAPTTTTTIRFPIPPGIRCARDAEPAARELATRMAAHSLATADALYDIALANVCLAAMNGEGEVVLRTPERIVQ